jgi:hypothetical protein
MTTIETPAPITTAHTNYHLGKSNGGSSVSNCATCANSNPENGVILGGTAGSTGRASCGLLTLGVAVAARRAAVISSAKIGKVGVFNWTSTNPSLTLVPFLSRSRYVARPDCLTIFDFEGALGSSSTVHLGSPEPVFQVTQDHSLSDKMRPDREALQLAVLDIEDCCLGASSAGDFRAKTGRLAGEKGGFAFQLHRHSQLCLKM